MTQPVTDEVKLDKGALVKQADRDAGFLFGASTLNPGTVWERRMLDAADLMRKLAAALSQPSADVEGEAVAWKIVRKHTEVPTYTAIRELAEAYRDHEGATITPLYATPTIPVTSGRDEGLEALRFISVEATAANEVIKLSRDGNGQGRIRVATALHRIAERAAAALKGSTP